MPMHILFGDWFLFLEESYFKNHLKMYLNVLEKKKEKREISFSALGRKLSFPAPFSSLLAQPRSCLTFGRGPHCGPAQDADAADRLGPLLSGFADTSGPRRSTFFHLVVE
jgi:hypothetical protein